MKRILGICSLAALITIMSCGDDKPAEVRKEVVVVPPKEPAKKPTTISLDKNGVKVETKKVDVSVKKQ